MILLDDPHTYTVARGSLGDKSGASVLVCIRRQQYKAVKYSGGVSLRPKQATHMICDVLEYPKYQGNAFCMETYLK